MNNLHEFDNGSGNKNLIEYQKQATVKEFMIRKICLHGNKLNTHLQTDYATLTW